MTPADRAARDNGRDPFIVAVGRVFAVLLAAIIVLAAAAVLTALSLAAWRWVL